ncbi:MAG: hypothetical protein GY769_23795 [bacterium]|nr:hypothetical protein [bacterium]
MAPGLRNTLFALGLIALALLLWAGIYESWSASHDLGFSWRAVLFVLLFLSGVLSWGVVPVLVAPAAREVWNVPVTLLVGTSLVGVWLLALSFLLPITPLTALVALCAVGGALVWLSARRGAFGRLRAAHGVSPECLIAVVVGLLAATLWSWGHLQAFVETGGDVAYGPFTDSLGNARIVALFGTDQLPQVLGHPDLAGVPPGFYHYGTYAVAGAFSAITESPALTAIDAFAMPWGVLMLALAAFALGDYWWGPRGGLAALAGAVLLPDASYYGFKNTFLSYHWLMQTSPSLSWGLAIGACSVLVADRACRRADLRMLSIAALLALIALLFKAQLAALLVPSLLLWVVFSFSGLRTRVRLAWLGMGAGAFVLLAGAASQLRRAPRTGLSQDWAFGYLSFLTTTVDGEVRRELWQQILASEWLVPRIGMIVVACFGILPLIYLTALVVQRRRRELKPSDLFPLTLFSGYLLIVFGLAENTNGPGRFELHHRPFVLVYFYVAVWCIGWLGVQLTERRSSPRSRYLRTLGMYAVVPLLAFPLLLGAQVQGQRLPFSNYYMYTPLPRAFLTCVDYIRSASSRTDVVQISTTDPKGVFGALSERTAYLARPKIKARQFESASVASSRAKDLANLAATHELVAFQAQIARLPIRWFMLVPRHQPGWPPEVLANPTRECDGYRVYDFDTWRAP